MWSTIAFLACLSIAPVPTTLQAESPPSVDITFRNGRHLTGDLDGVGCSAALCSRAAVRGVVPGGAAATPTRFDTIERIVTVAADAWDVHLENGDVRRLSIVRDSRVLYVRDADGHRHKVDLAEVAAVDFLSQTSRRTPWGDPDLQGVWSGVESIGVPMERDPTLGTRNVLTESEFELLKTRLVAGASSGNIEATNFGAETDLVRFQSRQASLVIDPADGRRPARLPEAQSRRPVRNSFVPGPVDSVADLGVYDRCIAWTAVPAAFPVNALEIVQAPGYVAIRTEVIHGTRVIPLDGRAHLGRTFRTFDGDSRGRWDGRTLVVETTNLNGLTSLIGNEPLPTDRTTISERFALVDPETLSYEATVSDPGTWLRSWTLAFPRKREATGAIYEYACHEGNYGIANILRASRAADANAR